MHSAFRPLCFLILLVQWPFASAAADQADGRLTSDDLFDLQYASEVRISPEGERVVYVRSIHDIMCDCARTNLWIVDSDGDHHQPLLSGRGSYSSPRFSPTGDRLVYVAKDETDQTQLFVRWMETGQTAMVSNLVESPSFIAWSPDGTEIQGWYLTPPDFDPEDEYPLILEIHGGPHLAYDPHFSAEMQRMAAEGYVILAWFDRYNM